MGSHCSKLDGEGLEEKNKQNQGTVRVEGHELKVPGWYSIEGFNNLSQFLMSDELNENLRRGLDLRGILLKLRFKDYKEVNEISIYLMIKLGFSKTEGPDTNNIFLENEKSNAYIADCKSMLVPDLLIFCNFETTTIRNLNLPLDVIEYFTQLYQMDKYAKFSGAKGMSDEWWRNFDSSVTTPFDFLFKKTEKIKQLLRTEVHYHNPLLISGVESKFINLDNRTLEVTTTGGTLNSMLDNQSNSVGSNRPLHTSASPFKGIEKSVSKTRNSFTNFRPLVFNPSLEPIMTPERSKVMEFTFDEKNIGKLTFHRNSMNTPERVQNVIMEDIEEYDVNEEEGPKDSNESGYIVKSYSGKKTEKSEESVPLLKLKKKH